MSPYARRFITSLARSTARPRPQTHTCQRSQPKESQGHIQELRADLEETQNHIQTLREELGHLRQQGSFNLNLLDRRMESQYRELKARITDVRSHAESYHKSTQKSFITLNNSISSMFSAHKSEFRDAFKYLRAMQKLDKKWEPTLGTELEIERVIRESIDDVHKRIALEKQNRLRQTTDRFFMLVFWGGLTIMAALFFLIIVASPVGEKASQAESKKPSPHSDPAVDSQRFPEHREIFPPSCEHDEH